MMFFSVELPEPGGISLETGTVLPLLFYGFIVVLVIGSVVVGVMGAQRDAVSERELIKAAASIGWTAVDLSPYRYTGEDDHVKWTLSLPYGTRDFYFYQWVSEAAAIDGALQLQARAPALFLGLGNALYGLSTAGVVHRHVEEVSLAPELDKHFLARRTPHLPIDWTGPSVMVLGEYLRALADKRTARPRAHLIVPTSFTWCGSGLYIEAEGPGVPELPSFDPQRLKHLVILGTALVRSTREGARTPSGFREDLRRCSW